MSAGDSPPTTQRQTSAGSSCQHPGMAAPLLPPRREMAARAAQAAARAVAAACGEPSLVSKASSRPALLRGEGRPLPLLGEHPPAHPLSLPPAWGHNMRRASAGGPGDSLAPSAACWWVLRASTPCMSGGEPSCAASSLDNNSDLKSIGCLLRSEGLESGASALPKAQAPAAAGAGGSGDALHAANPQAANSVVGNRVKARAHKSGVEPTRRPVWRGRRHFLDAALPRCATPGACSYAHRYPAELIAFRSTSTESGKVKPSRGERLFLQPQRFSPVSRF